MQWVDQQLNVWSKQTRSFFELNPTASLIWLLCDGSRTTDEIITQLEGLDPDSSEQIRYDILETLAEFQEKGLLRLVDHQHPPRTIKRVGFCNFWGGFNVRDNYVLWVLSCLFDVLIVAPDDETLDLLIFSEYPSIEFDHTQTRSEHVQRIQVCLETKPDFEWCDYAFSPHTLPGADGARHFQLPLWALYLDWFNLAPSATAFQKHTESDRYTPQAAAGYLSHALFRSETKTPERLRMLEHVSLKDKPPRKLTIGMATYDDFEGTYSTVQAIRLFHPEVTADTEIVILDNNPDSPAGEALRSLVSWMDGLRYIPYGEWQSTAVRDVVFREARTPYVLCLDSLVFIVPGGLRKLISWFDDHPDTGDLLQGVLLGDDLEPHGTYFKPEWSQGMYGIWGIDDRAVSPEAEPFEIPMHGLGLFACRREAWLGFNPRFRGSGGEEGYIHEKYRQAGHKTLCLPFLRWLHRFGRPGGVRNTADWLDRVINYHLGFQELGLDTSPINDHFRSHLGETHFQEIQAQVRAELTNPFRYFDAIYCINLDTARNRWRAMQLRFQRLGIARRVRRFSAVYTSESQHIGCALSHRMIIEQAQKQGLEQIMVFEDDAIFQQDTLTHLEKTIPELKQQDWYLFYLGGHRWGHDYQPPEGCQHLSYVQESLTCTQAIAYHHSVYQQLLDAIPATEEEVRDWLEIHHGIDQYYLGVDKRYLARPVVASQPNLLGREDQNDRGKFL